MDIKRYEEEPLSCAIKRERKNREMTQQELANLVGVQKAAICRYEKGYKNPSVKVLKKLIKVLDLNMKEIK